MLSFFHETMRWDRVQNKKNTRQSTFIKKLGKASEDNDDRTVTERSGVELSRGEAR